MMSLATRFKLNDRIEQRFTVYKTLIPARGEAHSLTNESLERLSRNEQEIYLKSI